MVFRKVRVPKVSDVVTKADHLCISTSLADHLCSLCQGVISYEVQLKRAFKTIYKKLFELYKNAYFRVTCLTESPKSPCSLYSQHSIYLSLYYPEPSSEYFCIHAHGVLVRTI